MADERTPSWTRIDSEPAAVWQTAPGRSAVRPDVTLPFRSEPRSAGGRVSDFRTGTLSVGASGVDIDGRAVLPPEALVPILLACFLLKPGFLIAYLILEFVLRRPLKVSIPWSDVERVVNDPGENRIAMVYSAAAPFGRSSQVSLAFRADDVAFAAGLQAFGKRVPRRIAEESPRRTLTAGEWMLILYFVVAAAWIVIHRFAAGHAA